jgi:hypothetical protein
MNLYPAPGACSLALQIALGELGLPVDMRTLTCAELARMIARITARVLPQVRKGALRSDCRCAWVRPAYSIIHTTTKRTERCMR